jgi:muramidase (phage lysozyme)
MPKASVWACIRTDESSDNYRANTGNGFYGAYQFTATTWASLHTGYARADLAPAKVQDLAAVHLQARYGWSAWPITSAECGA